MNSFTSFHLSEPILASIARIGFTEPTEIQQKAIPVLMAKKDLIGQSKTGSGKTAAYMLPVLEALANSDRLALVLVPTRELALQVEEFVRKLLSKNTRAKLAVIIGGGNMKGQQNALSQKPNLIIATPGRLIDHITRGGVKFESLTTVVLDEADRMLDMGFLPQIKRVLARLPKDRQTALFSATFSPEIRKLAKDFMKNPDEVSVGQSHQAPVLIDQQVIETSSLRKNDRLLDELNARDGSILIFAKTKHKTDKLSRYLLSYGFKVNRIHGDRTLAQRKQAIHEFKTGGIRILVATDIAARGLDIAQVGHVINFDLPQNPEDYLHRIGRTGRAGNSGQALSFVTPDERQRWRAIKKFSTARPY